jgi:hypothetical protein
MSGRLIRYPSGWTLAVLDDHDAAEAAVGALAATGIDGEDLVLIDAAGTGIDRLGSSSGLAGRLRRAVQFMTMDQLPDLHVYEMALARQHPVVGARVADADLRRRVVEVLQRHGGHFINRFGAWATEEIAPWRGEPLPVGQLMQR